MADAPADPQVFFVYGDDIFIVHEDGDFLVLLAQVYLGIFMSLGFRMVIPLSDLYNRES